MFYFTYIKTYATMQGIKTNVNSSCLLFIEVFDIILGYWISLEKFTLILCLLWPGPKVDKSSNKYNKT